MASIRPAVEEAASRAHEALLDAASRAEADASRRLESDRRALADNLFRAFELQTALLREKIAVLAVVNVFFLLNVDAYTRDDLMSMLAVKLAASLLDPRLFLDQTTAEVLALLFQSLRISDDFLKELRDPALPIYPCIRTGQWILSDSEYLDFLKHAKSSPSKNAEPLSRIVKSLTITQTNRSLAEEILRILAALLGALGPSAAGGRGALARRAFSQALLELTNACFRAVYAENFSNDFVRDLKTPRPDLDGPRRAQDEALRRLEPWLAGQAPQLPYHDRDVELQGWAQDDLLRASEELLFERLRVLCILQLQLVNVSAYSLTGEAVKVASLLASAELTRERLPTYWLLCFFEGMASLGYSLEVLKQVLRFWQQEKTVLLFSGPGAASLTAAREAFQQLRAILQPAGGGSERTPCFVNFFQAAKNVPNNLFRDVFADFLSSFVLRTRDKLPIKEGLEVADKSAVVTKRQVAACKAQRRGPAADFAYDTTMGGALLEAVSADWANDPHVQEDHLSAQELTQAILQVNAFFRELLEG
jgi:hypothetical protein